MKKVALVALLAGCKGSIAPNLGDKMQEFFPFEQNKDCLWEFAHEDLGLVHGMAAEVTNFEFLDDGVDVFEVSFVKDCRGQFEECTDGELIRRMYWSIKANQGVKLTGIDTAGSTFTFDPPIQFADHEMRQGSSVETSTGGSTYTATYVERGECPVPLETFERCAKIEIASSDGVPAVVGTYWAINGFNIVAIDWPDQNGLWKLIRHTTLE